jgi:MFS family permease
MEPRSPVLRHVRIHTIAVLTTVYTLNVLDRFILGILLPYIKREMDLDDTLLGLLTGPAFAIFYATMSLPIARLSDRYTRKYIIAVCLFLFSLMTLLCGFATGFWHLFLARIGVGVGEAGTMPASTSMVADLYPKERRASAMAWLSFGANIGAMLAFIVGGVIAAQYGWRMGFFIVGIPGILFSLYILIGLREPARGSMEANTPQATTTPPFAACLGFLRQQRAYWMLTMGFALLVAVSSANMVWLASFFERSHGLSTATSGPVIGLAFGLGGAFGTIFVGGYISDRVSRDDISKSLSVIAIGAIVLAIGLLLILLAPTGTLALTAIAIPGLLGIFFQGPLIALTLAVSPLSMRATANAICLFLVSMVGYGLGPPLVGIVSDHLNPSYGDDALRMALFSMPALCIIAAGICVATRRPLLDNIERAERFTG